MRASMPRLSNLLRVATNDGVVEADPSADPTGYGHLLEASHDHRVSQNRQDEDATPLVAGIDPAQAAYFRSVNRGQEDAAMGAAGYNRPWAGFLEAPQVVGENAGMPARLNARGLSSSIATLRSRTRPGADGPYGAFGSGPATEGPYGAFGSGPATEGPYGPLRRRMFGEGA